MDRYVRTIISLLVALALLAVASPGATARAAPAYLDPALARAGNAHIAVIVTAENSEAAARAVADAGGVVTNELWLIDAVAANVPAGSLTALAATSGIRAVVGDRAVTSPSWSARRAKSASTAGIASPTRRPGFWEVSYPINIGIGADILHDGNVMTASGKMRRKPVTGQGVTIAVVDSGVLLNADALATLGPSLAGQYVGQADFVTPECAVIPRLRGRTLTIGKQRAGYCWHSLLTAGDGYGHGTAVASIIWNNARDINTRDPLGVAPGASILSVRVLGDDGSGTYATVIKGIQYVVEQREKFDIRVMNLSLSAPADVPYFVDPLNKAVEEAWLHGVTVVAAAGNNGDAPGSISVPGNDPYVITVGALDENRTAGDKADDRLPFWSAAGPTADGFIKPDVVAPGVNVLTYLYKDPRNPSKSQRMAEHPQYQGMTGFFPMDGTSMAAAVTSGAVALVLQVNADLTPDQVKYRLMESAQPATIGADTAQPLAYSVFRQGMGRLWTPDAALGTFDPSRTGNPGMDLEADWGHGYATLEDLAYHYQGPVRSTLDEEGVATLFYIDLLDGGVLGLGAWGPDDGWLTSEVLGSRRLIWITGGAPGPDGTIEPSRRLIWITAWEPGADGTPTWVGSDPDADIDSSRRLIWITSQLPAPYAPLTWVGDRPLPSAIESSRRLIWITSQGFSGNPAAWTDGALPVDFATVEPSRRLIWITGYVDWTGGIQLHSQDIEPSRRLIWITSHDVEPSRRLIWITAAEPLIVLAP